MKTLLYFTPYNILKNNAGAISTAWNYLKIFERSGITVDYVNSADTWGGRLSEEDVALLKKKKLVRRVFSLPRKPNSIRQFKHWLGYRMLRLWRDIQPWRTIPNFVTNYNQYLFNKILKQDSYDYIIISYIYWADFVRNNPHTSNTQLIIDTHDFLTAQEWVGRKVNIGKTFAEEIRRLNFFDQIWTVSIEEQYLFQQFISKKVVLVPFCTDDHTNQYPGNKEYDIIYVAGDNRHNVKAAEWFFKQVYPLLSTSRRYCVVGNITKHIPDEANIHKVPYAENLEDYYSRAMLAICPMFSGTGVKVKVIEALSYGMPVVCSPRGVDGLANKTSNGCVAAESAEEFAKSINMLLSNVNYYKQVSEDAIGFFKKNHSPQRLQDIIHGALNN